MRKQLQERAAEAVSIAKKAGANDVWADASRVRSVEFRVRDGKVEKVQESTSRSLNLQLYVDGRYSTHGTTDLRPEQLTSFVTEAVALTRALQPDKYREIPDKGLFAGRPSGDLDLVDPKVLSISRDQRMAVCQAMNERIAGKKQVITATSVSYDSHAIGAAASSNGFAGDWEASSVGAYSSVNMQDAGDKRPSSYFGMRARHLGELGDPAAIADRALERTRMRLGSKKGPSKRTRMVVDNLSAGRLISRLLGPASGWSVQQKRSFWADGIGKKSVNEKLTIIDDPLVPRGLGSRPFDDEGIAAKRMPIIESGVLKNFYLDTYYAKKLGMAPTTGRASNRIVTPGSRDLPALLASADGGIFVTGWLGGNMDSTTGDFSFGVQGHTIEKGAIGAPISEMNVTGNIRDLFANLVELGSDVWMHSSLRAPSMVFDDVEFSGV